MIKRIASLAAVVCGSLFLFGANAALGATDPGCTALGGDDTTVPGVCQVSAPVTATGVIPVGEPLHMLNGGVITVASPSLELDITGDFTMDAGSLIDGGNHTCGGPNTTAFPVTIHVDGNIDIKGPDGATPGAIVRSNGCSGGAIVITSTPSHTVDIDGLVESVGARSGTGATQGPGGGPITIVGGCALTISDSGKVSSRGSDPGADLVHIEGCTVVINGLVESTGPGHGVPNAPTNHCYYQVAGFLNNPPGGPPPANPRPDKPSNSTACVEIWSGTTVTIDATPPHNGQVNADIGQSGGGTGRSWIDVYANGNVNIVGDTAVPFAVHANMGLQGHAGIITVKSVTGDVIASDLAIQADNTAGGGDGGEIHVEARNNLNFNTASVFARGDFASSGGFGVGGQIGTDTSPPCTTCFISNTPVRAWNGGITWTTGDGDVRPTGTGDVAHPVSVGQRGEIVLQACAAGGGITLGATFPVNVAAAPPFPKTLASACGGGPTLPAYVTLPSATCLQTFCSRTATKSGTKFFDTSNNHKRDAGEPGIANWNIKIFDSSNVEVANLFTNGSGAYTANLAAAPGGTSYTVCEVPQVGYTQTCPQVGLDCNLAVASTADCSALTGPPATVGYAITLQPGDNDTGNDFGNFRATPACPEDPNAKITIAVDQLGKPHGSLPVYQTVQAAYNNAVNGDIIGMFTNTVENIVLGDDKTLKITQCTSARVTAANNGLPVWDITSTGQLTIVGPDSVGGTVGWLVESDNQTLKSVRANGASQNGIRITSDSNSVSWNDVSGNGSGGATDGGIQVTGGSNTLKGGTVGPNNGDGVRLEGNTNNLSGATIKSNTGNGVYVSGSFNTVKSNSRIDQNGKNGIWVTSTGGNNTIQSNASESGKGNAQNGVLVDGNTNQLTDNKMYSNVLDGFKVTGTGNKLKSNQGISNLLHQFEIGPGNTDQTGNKANGVNCTFTTAAGGTC